MKVYERLARAFRDEGVVATFGMMGDGNMLWLSEMHKLGAKVHEVRHEGCGLGMADGWARLTGTPGVATTTSGPGVTQLATALVVASRARSPVVAFCGEHPISDSEHNQRFDPASFAAACETGFVRLSNVEDTDQTVRHAFFRARTESRPVLLSVPMDLQDTEIDADEPYLTSSTLMGGSRAFPDPQALQHAAEVIATSRKPIVLVGRGGQRAGAGEALIRLSERIGALIATSLMAKTYLNENEFHVGIAGNYASRAAIELFQEADCVIAVGASLNRYTIEHGYLFAEAKYIQIDSSPNLIMGNGRAADCYVTADARVGVEMLDRILAERGTAQVGFRTAATRAKLQDHLKDRIPFELDPDTVDPREACELIDAIVPPEIGIVSGTGMVANISNMTMHRQRPITMASHFFSCIGQMFPVAMGAVVASGGAPAVLLNGDASTMMHIGEFETAVRYSLPLLIVVMNNEALGPEYYSLRNKGLDSSTAAVSTPDLGFVGRAMGGRGYFATTIGQLRTAIEEWVANPGPMIIDLRVSRTVLPIPYRRLYHGLNH